MLEGSRIVAQHGAQHLGHGASLKRSGAREHFVEDRAETEDVRTCIERFPFSLFRRQVSRRTHHGAIHSVARYVRVGGRHGFGQSEVEQFRCPACSNEDVGRLQVAMDDASAVCFLKCASNLNR